MQGQTVALRYETHPNVTCLKGRQREAAGQKKVLQQIDILNKVTMYSAQFYRLHQEHTNFDIKTRLPSCVNREAPLF